MWSPSYPDQEQMETDVGDMLDIFSYKQGRRIWDKTMSYLNDR